MHVIETQYFPGWKKKSITFSIDDGNLEMDARFIAIVKPAGITGTFNLCSDRLNQMSAQEYREFYDGFEIANHCKYHPYAFADGETYSISDQPFDPETSDPEGYYRVEDVPGLYWKHTPRGWRKIADADFYIESARKCKEELEAVFGEVKDYVWPYTRQKNKTITDFIEGGFFASSRAGVAGGTQGRDLFQVPDPQERMCWSYTATHLTLTQTYEKYEKQPDNGSLKFFCVGVHSIDFETGQKWADLQDFADKLKVNRDYYFAGVGDIFRRSDAAKAVKVEKDRIINPSKEYEVYVKVDGQPICIQSGGEYRLS